MPTRFISGAVALLASIPMIMVTAVSTTGLISETIWDKAQFRMYCFMGSMGGAYLAIAIFPNGMPVNQLRMLAVKFLASGVAGLLFTPIIIRWQGWPLDVDVILAVSGATALMAVSTLHTIVPYAIKKLKEKIDKL